ncbi:hypothetical protein ES705_14806 [subsurface metagenome]
MTKETTKPAKQMDRILLSENTDLAIKQIQTLKQRARETTAIIQVFNSVNLLNPITSQEMLIAFLKNPVDYFDNRIIEDLDSSSDVKGLPQKVAEYRGIPYDEIVDKIASCQLRNLKNHIFNEAARSVEFNESCTKKIQESFFEYTETEQEAKAVNEIRALCQLLNQHCARWGVDASSMNVAANSLGLKIEYLPGAKQNDERQCEFKEHITNLRSRLSYESNYE